MDLKNLMNKKLTLSIPVVLAVIFVFAFGVTMFDILLTLKSVRGAFSFLINKPLLVLINMLPVLAASLIIFFISGNGVFSSVLVCVIFAILGVVNIVKITMRQDPLIPSDLTLVVEVYEIVKGFSLSDILLYVCIIAGGILLVAASFIFFKTKKINIYVRIISLVAVCIASFILNTAVYDNENLYNSFAVDGNQYFEVNQYESKGFIYCFFHKLNTMKISSPEGYAKALIEEAEKDFVPSEEEKFPHIIMIMGEAYSDLSENENIDFSNYTDPMENFKAISSSENAQSGHIIVPGYGGGTSDTEFEVLTGYFKRALGSPITSYNLIRKDIDALPWRLKDMGYDTLAIHPGFSWFYNRVNVYNYMGFDNFIHLESFQGEEKYKGGYIADKYATDCIIEEFENHISQSDSPFFEFCVTIENHGPYDEKYNTVEKMFDSKVPLTEKEETLLNSYFMGIRDADIELKRLTDYFESSDEPVVLVYFGDHLPGFSNGMEFFDILDYNIDSNGTTEQILNVYKTPYLIWQNSAAAQITDFNENKDTLSTPYNTMSAAYLGAYALELIGMDNVSPVFNYINDIRKELPVITEGHYLLEDGTYSDSITENEKTYTDILSYIIYYKMIE